MTFENLDIKRIVVHEIYPRNDEREIVTPLYGDVLVTLNQEALEAFRDRIGSAIGSAAKCMELDILQANAGCSIALAKDLVDADEALFIEMSRALADRLASAQTRRDIPGGVLVIFSGSTGYPSKRILGMIKAETHNGFTRQVGRGGAITLQYLNNLLLTPQTKLYKVGIFMEEEPGTPDPLPAGWRAFIYDHLISVSNKLGAAQYFYEGFLGCGFPESNARITREFHDYTKEFIQGLNLSEEKKTDLHNALVTYLKVDQSLTIQVAVFAQTYLPDPELRQEFTRYMANKKFPDGAVLKDLSDVSPSLKYRKVTFAGNFKLIGPAERFKDTVDLKEIDGDADEQGQIPIWTQVIIRNRIVAQE